MCERFTLTWEGRQVVAALGVQDAGDAFADYRPRFNIAPTDQPVGETRKPSRAGRGSRELQAVSNIIRKSPMYHLKTPAGDLFRCLVG
jgi:putative SOS response-associated peptidase YedK